MKQRRDITLASELVVYQFIILIQHKTKIMHTKYQQSHCKQQTNRSISKLYVSVCVSVSPKGSSKSTEEHLRQTKKKTTNNHIAKYLSQNQYEQKTSTSKTNNKHITIKEYKTSNKQKKNYGRT